MNVAVRPLGCSRISIAGKMRGSFSLRKTLISRLCKGVLALGILLATVSIVSVEAAPKPMAVSPNIAPNSPDGATAAVDTRAGLKRQQAAKLYMDNCAICHGDRGDGDTRAQTGMRPPPRDFTTIETAFELNRERMIGSVTNGRPGTGMMPHKDRLSKQEIELVVDFIRENFMRTPDESEAIVKNLKGRLIYNKNCAVCHGDKGNTAIWARSGLNPPPRDFTAPKTRLELTRERMIHSVTNGRPGTGMMPFKTRLDAVEVAAVVDYIREVFLRSELPAATAGATAALGSTALQLLPQDANHAAMRARQADSAAAPMNPHAAPPAVSLGAPSATGNPVNPTATEVARPAVLDADMSVPMPGGLKGDITAGRRFFLSNCFTCHGVTGDGNGPRAHFNNPRPRNFTSEESQRSFNRARLFDSITNGKIATVMPAWSKVLTPQQIADVAEFVFVTFIQPATGKKKAS